MTGGLIFFSASWLRTEFVKYTGITVGLYELPLLIQVATCYLIYTFLDYWAHRLAHLSCFWPLHRFHHAAEDFCIFTSVRVHPADLTGVGVELHHSSGSIVHSLPDRQRIGACGTHGVAGAGASSAPSCPGHLLRSGRQLQSLPALGSDVRNLEVGRER